MSCAASAALVLALASVCAAAPKYVFFERMPGVGYDQNNPASITPQLFLDVVGAINATPSE